MHATTAHGSSNEGTPVGEDPSQEEKTKAPMPRLTSHGVIAALDDIEPLMQSLSLMLGSDLRGLVLMHNETAPYCTMMLRGFMGAPDPDVIRSARAIAAHALNRLRLAQQLVFRARHELMLFANFGIFVPDWDMPARLRAFADLSDVGTMEYMGRSGEYTLEAGAAHVRDMVVSIVSNQSMHISAAIATLILLHARLICPDEAKSMLVSTLGLRARHHINFLVNRLSA